MEWGLQGCITNEGLAGVRCWLRALAGSDGSTSGKSVAMRMRTHALNLTDADKSVTLHFGAEAGVTKMEFG